MNSEGLPRRSIRYVAKALRPRQTPSCRSEGTANPAMSERAQDLVTLAIWMQGERARTGVCLSDVEARFGVKRSTAERMLRAVKDIFGQYEPASSCSTPRKRWRTSPTARSSSAFAPAAPRRWPGICGPGATRSRSSSLGISGSGWTGDAGSGVLPGERTAPSATRGRRRACHPPAAHRQQQLSPRAQIDGGPQVPDHGS